MSSDIQNESGSHSRLEAQRRVDEICDQFEASWAKFLESKGKRPELADHVEDFAQLDGLLLELLALDIAYRVRIGEKPEHKDYDDLNVTVELWRRASLEDADSQISSLFRIGPDAPAELSVLSSLSSDPPFNGIPAKDAIDKSKRDDLADEEPPVELHPQVGRYHIRTRVGSGGFGSVYLAYDQQLKRDVAIKIPHVHRFVTQRDVKAFLQEARIAAALDHEAIVPIYDFGKTEDNRCYVVSKWIQGESLRERMRRDRVGFSEAASTAAKIADALHHAHEQGVSHRDVKPANILVEKATGRVYLTDFGLATSDEVSTQRLGGTPAYMSPEQSRGENHLVDARSDIFSLGAVLYEMMSDRVPYADDSKTATPPNDFTPNVPARLEEVCLKAISLPVMDRYQSALEFRNDLQDYLSHRNDSEQNVATNSAEAHLPPAKNDVNENTIVSGAKNKLVIGLVLTTALVAACAFFAVRWNGHRLNAAEQLCQRLFDAELDKVPEIVSEIDANSTAMSLLQSKLDSDDGQESMRAAIGLASQSVAARERLVRELPFVPPDEFQVLTDRIPEINEAQEAFLWEEFSPQGRKITGRKQRAFQAAIALLKYVPDKVEERVSQRFLLDHLTHQDPLRLAAWSKNMPVQPWFREHLRNIFERSKNEDQRLKAFRAGLFFAEQEASNTGKVDWLVDVFCDSTQKTFEEAFRKVKQREEAVITLLVEKTDATAPWLANDKKELIARRQTNAAVALVRLGGSSLVMHQFSEQDDMSAANDFARRAKGLGVTKNQLNEMMELADRPSGLCALLRCMGEYGGTHNASSVMAQTAKKYLAHPNPEVHAACERLLHRAAEEKLLEEERLEAKQLKEKNASR